MPRRARLALPGIPWHIIQRGNNRAICFHAEEVYQFYPHYLNEFSGKFGCHIHAYVLMTNHGLVTEVGLATAYQRYSLGAVEAEFSGYTDPADDLKKAVSWIDRDDAAITIERDGMTGPIVSAGDLLVDSRLPDELQGLAALM